MRILDFGSMNIDYIYRVEHIVRPEETLSCEKMNVHSGGKGLNQAIAVAKTGTEIHLAGMIGQDGGFLLDKCKSNGVNTSMVRQMDNLKTGHTIIQVDETGQNCILVYGGSNKNMSTDYIDDVLSNFSGGDIIILQNEINYIDYIINKAYELGMVIVLNPSPMNDSIKNCDLSKVSIFILNEIEGNAMTNISDPEAMLDKLIDLYPNSKYVLTLGENGVIYRDKDKQYYQGIYNVNVVDTTGAGDTFTGYFIYGLVNNIPIDRLLSICAKASSITVTREGAAESIPTLQEVLGQM